MRELSYEQAERGSTGGDLAILINCTQKKNDAANMIGNLYYSCFHGAVRKALHDGPFDDRVDIYVASRRSHDADYGLRPLHESPVSPYDNLIEEHEHEAFIEMAHDWFVEHDEDYSMCITFLSNRFEKLIDEATYLNSGCENFSMNVAHTAGRARLDRVCQLHNLMYTEHDHSSASEVSW